MKPKLKPLLTALVVIALLVFVVNYEQSQELENSIPVGNVAGVNFCFLAYADSRRSVPGH